LNEEWQSLNQHGGMSATREQEASINHQSIAKHIVQTQTLPCGKLRAHFS